MEISKVRGQPKKALSPVHQETRIDAAAPCWLRIDMPCISHMILLSYPTQTWFTTVSFLPNIPGMTDRRWSDRAEAEPRREHIHRFQREKFVHEKLVTGRPVQESLPGRSMATFLVATFFAWWTNSRCWQ